MIGRIGRRWGFAASVVVLAYYGPAAACARRAAEGRDAGNSAVGERRRSRALTPKKARSTADADPLAESLYSAGRLYEQREQYGQRSKMYPEARAATIGTRSRSCSRSGRWPSGSIVPPKGCVRQGRGARPRAIKSCWCVSRGAASSTAATRPAARALRAHHRREGRRPRQVRVLHHPQADGRVVRSAEEGAAKRPTASRSCDAGRSEEGRPRRRRADAAWRCGKTYEQFGQGFTSWPPRRCGEGVRAGPEGLPNRALLAYHMARGVFLQKKEPEKACSASFEVCAASKPEPAGREP